MKRQQPEKAGRSANGWMTMAAALPLAVGVGLLLTSALSSARAAEESVGNPADNAVGEQVSPASAPPPVRPVADLDIDRYLGVWYEIAKYPNYFQRRCASDTRAIYRKRNDGLIGVTNRCRTLDGKVEQVQGVARPDATPPYRPSQLQVRFAPSWLGWLPFVWGRYWVVLLDSDYRYAVVSEPKRKYLWILSRDRQMDNATYTLILTRLQAMGFDTTKVVPSPQPGA